MIRSEPESDGATPHLRLRDVAKTYGDTIALHPVSFDVSRGETLVLVGASGSGKSTLLKTVNRLVEPTRGRVEVDGVALSETDPVALRRRMGYVQQDGGLLPHWTVRRNVELVPTLLGWDPERRRERAAELLDAVSLDPRRTFHRHPHELSGGERQRVAIARALCADPEVLLLDEPFSALDAITRAGAQAMFEGLTSTRERTVVLVTHDLREALRLGDRIAVLEAGHLRQLGTPGQISQEPEHRYVEELFALLE